MESMAVRWSRAIPIAGRMSQAGRVESRLFPFLGGHLESPGLELEEILRSLFQAEMMPGWVLRMEESAGRVVEASLFPVDDWPLWSDGKKACGIQWVQEAENRQIPEAIQV